jgi:hypothetical protein
MTRQTIIGQLRHFELGFILVMTLHTPAHRMLHHRLRHGHLRHIAVTRGAVHTGRDVSLMIEIDVSMGRKAIDANPGDFLLLIEIRLDLLNFQTLRLDTLMAKHALLHTGNASDGRLFRVLVTERAGGSLLDVLLVTEGNRLPRRAIGESPQHKPTAAKNEDHNDG